MRDTDKPAQAVVRGGADAISVFLSPDRQAMGLRFDFQRPIEGVWQTIPTEVLLDTQVGMALLQTLQEVQRVFDIPMPEGGTLTLQREQE